MVVSSSLVNVERSKWMWRFSKVLINGCKILMQRYELYFRITDYELQIKN
jgi:hypothetical protein